MMQNALSHFSELWMTLIALLIFMTLFLSFFIYVYWFEPKSSIEYKQNIPFMIDEEGKQQ